MNNKKRLELVHELLNSDTAFEASSLCMDKKSTKKEKEYGALIGKIYEVVHPSFCSANHTTWDEENEKLCS